MALRGYIGLQLNYSGLERFPQVWPQSAGLIGDADSTTIDQRASIAVLPPPERLPRIQQELAIHLYPKSLLSFGKARELAQLTKWEFHALLGHEAIERSDDLEELENDLATLECLP
jgi:predicted HTH domain antitoxin